MIFVAGGKTSARLHELDSMRAVAALGVICWHYVHAFNAAPLGSLLAPFYGRGLLMVDFFFVLSGFVLTNAFWTDRRAPHFVASVRARVARMYPLHAAMLVTVAVLQCYLVMGLSAAPFIYTHNDPYHFVLNALLLNGSGLQEGFSFNAPAWSISTEFLVNLVFLGLISLPRRFARIGLLLVGSVALGAMAVRGVINGTRAFGVVDNDLVRTAAGFVVGVATAVARSRWSWRLPAWACDLAALVLLAACTVYLATRNLWSNTGDMLVCFVGFPALVLSVIGSGVVRSVLRLRPLVYLGEISYSIYLVHFPVQLLIHVASVRTGVIPAFGSPWFFLAFIAVVIAVAAVTYRLIELPGKRVLMPGRVAPEPV